MSSFMTELEVPVLVVGGSLVGMTAALLLGHHGVRSLVVEHHRGTAIHPRAASVTQRTMEIFRSVGLEDAVRTKSEAQFVQDAGVVGVETLAAGATAHYIANFNEGIRDLSPTVRVFLSQNVLEPTLRETAERLGARIDFSTECVSFEQDADGVSALIRHRDTGETRAGACALPDRGGRRAQPHPRSARRAHARAWDVLGKAVSRSISARIAQKACSRRPWGVGYMKSPANARLLPFEKPFDNGFLVINTLGDPAQPNVDVSTGLTAEDALRMVQTAIRSTELPATVENVMHWQARADTAERFRSGRVFIVGDAAHVMPRPGDGAVTPACRMLKQPGVEARVGAEWRRGAGAARQLRKRAPPDR